MKHLRKNSANYLDLFLEEKEMLTSRGVLDNWIGVDLRKDPDQLQKFIISFPIPTVLS